jgi:hypothetical protein
MEPIGKMTGGLLTLAMASTLSIADFEQTVKNSFPQISMNQLKADKKNNAQTKKLTQEKIALLKQELSVMAEVNSHTKDVFIPALETNFQRWAKEDLVSLKNAIVWMQKALTVRLKQYEVLSSLFKKGSMSPELLQQVETLKKNSRLSQKQIKTLKTKIFVMEEALQLFEASRKIDQHIKFEDFWVPAISVEEKNILIITEKSIQESQDYDTLNVLEETVQKELATTIAQSKYFSSVVLG